MLLKISQIQLNTSSFQFRSVEYNSERVQWLVDNWNADVCDPLDVWHSCEEYYLLSGHHRLEAMRRLGIETAECRVHAVDLEQAQVMALVSNSSRLNYTAFEYSRCIAHLISSGQKLSMAAKTMALSTSMAKKYYSLRFLVGTSWERHYEEFQLQTQAFDLCRFIESDGLSASEIESIFKVVTEQDLTPRNLQHLLKAIRKRRETAKSDVESNPETMLLFDLNEYVDDVVKTVKAQSLLHGTANSTWWLYHLVTDRSHVHDFPPEIAEPLRVQLRRLYAYCIGSDDENTTPKRRGGSKIDELPSE